MFNVSTNFELISLSEEEMEATVDARHIFVENPPRRSHTNVATRAVEVTEHKMAAYSSSSPESDVMMVMEPKSVAADKHVVVQRWVSTCTL